MSDGIVDVPPIFEGDPNAPAPASGGSKPTVQSLGNGYSLVTWTQPEYDPVTQGMVDKTHSQIVPDKDAASVAAVEAAKVAAGAAGISARISTEGANQRAAVQAEIDRARNAADAAHQQALDALASGNADEARRQFAITSQETERYHTLDANIRQQEADTAKSKFGFDVYNKLADLASNPRNYMEQFFRYRGSPVPANAGQYGNQGIVPFEQFLPNFLQSTFGASSSSGKSGAAGTSSSVAPASPKKPVVAPQAAYAAKTYTSPGPADGYTIPQGAQLQNVRDGTTTTPISLSDFAVKNKLDLTNQNPQFDPTKMFADGGTLRMTAPHAIVNLLTGKVAAIAGEQPGPGPQGYVPETAKFDGQAIIRDEADPYFASPTDTSYTAPDSSTYTAPSSSTVAPASEPVAPTAPAPSYMLDQGFIDSMTRQPYYAAPAPAPFRDIEPPTYASSPNPGDPIISTPPPTAVPSGTSAALDPGISASAGGSFTVLPMGVGLNTAPTNPLPIPGVIPSNYSAPDVFNQVAAPTNTFAPQPIPTPDIPVMPPYTPPVNNVDPPLPPPNPLGPDKQIIDRYFPQAGGTPTLPNTPPAPPAVVPPSPPVTAPPMETPPAVTPPAVVPETPPVAAVPPVAPVSPPTTTSATPPANPPAPTASFLSQLAALSQTPSGLGKNPKFLPEDAASVNPIVASMIANNAFPPFLQRIFAQQAGLAGLGTNVPQQTNLPPGVPLTSRLALSQMSPSELAAFQSFISANGIDWNDYLNLVDQSSPQGGTSKTTAYLSFLRQ